MSGTRNWNDMSSSEDEDSWFDDEEVPAGKKEQAPQPPKQEGTHDSPPSEDPKPQESTKPVEKVQMPAARPTFLKDEDLLTEYSNKAVDDPRVIKAVKVVNEEHKTLLHSLKNARVKEVKEGMFILNFHQPEGVLEFIRQKISNRYRFFLQPYFNSRREGAQEGKGGEQRRERYEKRERKARNQEGREEGKRGREERKQRQPKRQRDQGKRVYVQKEAFELESNKNILHIKSQAFEAGKVIAELEEKKVFKNFSKLYIKTPFGLLERVLKLVAEISSKYKFNLDKEPTGGSAEQIVDLTLVQGLKPSKPVEKHEKKEEALAKPVRKQQPRAHKQRQPLPVKEEKHARRLGGSFEEYFSELSINNLSEIVKGFDENEYVKRLKQNSSSIFDKNWNSWKIEGEDEFIEPLLKLVHRLKKSTIYDVELRPSTRSDRAVLTAQLRARPEKERRPKVDVSGVNGYLS